MMYLLLVDFYYNYVVAFSYRNIIYIAVTWITKTDFDRSLVLETNSVKVLPKPKFFDYRFNQVVNKVGPTKRRYLLFKTSQCPKVKRVGNNVGPVQTERGHTVDERENQCFSSLLSVISGVVLCFFCLHNVYYEEEGMHPLLATRLFPTQWMP